MTYHWQLQPADVAGDTANADQRFPSQSDAESWLGENWRELAAAGVVQVVLMDGEGSVYEMSLGTD